MGEQIYEEEYCNAQEEQERARSKAKEDVYKDDFSSDEDDNESETKNRKPSTNIAMTGRKQQAMTSFETSDLIFENSIRDNFQMQEATDLMRKVFDIGI